MKREPRIWNSFLNASEDMTYRGTDKNRVGWQRLRSTTKVVRDSAYQTFMPLINGTHYRIFAKANKISFRKIWEQVYDNEGWRHQRHDSHHSQKSFHTVSDRQVWEVSISRIYGQKLGNSFRSVCHRLVRGHYTFWPWRHKGKQEKILAVLKQNETDELSPTTNWSSKILALVSWSARFLIFHYFTHFPVLPDV